MSAYLCDPHHIGHLAAWYAGTGDSHGARHWIEQAGESERADEYNIAPALARVLARANIASLAYRYPDDTPGNRPGPTGIGSDEAYIEECSYVARAAGPWRDHAGHRTLVQVLKALSCYDYQACETPDWRGSPAQTLTDWIQDSAVALLDGYEEAEWGWPETAKV